METDEKLSSTVSRRRANATTENAGDDIKVDIEDKHSSRFHRVKSHLFELLLPKYNKQSSFMFGSELAFKLECERQRQAGAWVIHPLSSVRHNYVLVMVILTFLNLMSIPLEIAYSEEAAGVARTFWKVFNVFSDSLFLLDVILNFRMGILSDSDEIAIIDVKIIAKDYLRTWFIPDALASFPVDFIIAIADTWHDKSTTSLQGAKIMRILMFARILSMVRLLRVSRLVRFFGELEQMSNANLEGVRIFFRVIGLFMMMFILCHWNGCIQYFVPLLGNFPPDCWVKREDLMNATSTEKYTFGIFRALSHMIGISYGSEDPPTNELELWIVMTSMVSGALMYTIMVANAAAMMSNVDAPSKVYKNKLNHLDDYMAYRKLPRELRKRMHDYYQARYGGKWFDEREILGLLSKSLRQEILNVLCASMLESTPMFQDRDSSFINAILLQLRYEVFLEGDVIVRQNAPGDRMFFIEHGQVLVATDTFRIELCDGNYFGEICLLTRGKRVASVTALSTCHLFSLSVDSFNKVLECFPEVHKDIMSTALARQEDLKNAERECKELRCETVESATTSGLNDQEEELKGPTLEDLEYELDEILNGTL
ncbi:potassium/sodium hyperpolarization-activated cyclic nucleotide-gated channel 1-like isoform X2 [Sardina pilchardus]|uniref:potassium/sodium hyperpolarization-activated cyclic nucleotide-gated channel 1-like isoform X2 n=1 Tax=Sardina pilchardus TaxID=27697 RepID=UPI002E13B194